MEAWAIRQKFRNSSAEFGYGGHGNGDPDGLPDSNAMLWYNPLADNAESRLGIGSNPPRQVGNVFPEFKPEKGEHWAEFLVDEDEAIGALSTVGYSEMPADMKCRSDQSIVHSSVTYNNSAGNSSPSTPVEEQQSQISDVENEEEEEEQEERGRPGKKSSDEIVDSKKKRKRKTERGTKYTFKTKSESDSLEDGYKWRKYGRKFVKSNTHPRSYYRCADKRCDVKKRVERDPKDPSFLITTYEGNHNHESPSVIYYIGKPIILPQTGSKPAILLFNTGLY